MATAQPCPGDFASNMSAYSPSVDGSATTADERRQHEPLQDAAGPVCACCQRVVVDRYYLAALGVAWHVGCLTCQHCQRPLDSQLTCFVRDGAVYCRDDYYRYDNVQLFTWIAFIDRCAALYIDDVYLTSLHLTCTDNDRTYTLRQR